MLSANIPPSTDIKKSKQSVSDAKVLYEKIKANIEQVIKGQPVAIRLMLSGLVSGGHVLLEDHPGTGKTTLAKTLALSINTAYKRVQFTPDILPSDILGVSIYNQQDNTFQVHKGPIFTNILLADEINRASPRTQSALLECMAEGQVSIDGKHFSMEQIFFVIATQNPVGTHGTYPLPESQMDRFALKFSLGYVSQEEEAEILTDQALKHPLESIAQCVSAEEVMFLKEKAKEVTLTDELKEYIVALVRATRESADVLVGASPRASIAMMNVSKTVALFDGYDYVLPDHIKEIVVPVMSHRIILDPKAKFSGKSAEQVLLDAMKTVPVPV